MAEEKPIVAEKPPEPETWDKSQKDIVAEAVAWMYQACIDQGHKWNTLHAADPIVADGHRLVLADAARRGIPGVDIDVTYTDLLAAMDAYGKEEVGKARKARMERVAAVEKARAEAIAKAKAEGDANAAKARAEASGSNSSPVIEPRPVVQPPPIPRPPVEPFEPIP